MLAQAHFAVFRPGSALWMLNLLKHHFWMKGKKEHDFPSRYTAPEKLLFIDTKFKQELKKEKTRKPH